MIVIALVHCYTSWQSELSPAHISLSAMHRKGLIQYKSIRMPPVSEGKYMEEVIVSLLWRQNKTFLLLEKLSSVKYSYD